MKKLLSLTLALCLVLSLLAGCGSSGSDSAAVFTGTVTDAYEHSIMVEPLDGSSELNSSDTFSISLKSGTPTDIDGKSVEFSDIKIGATVEIGYDGSIMETYPAQIAADYVKVTNVPADEAAPEAESEPTAESPDSIAYDSPPPLTVIYDSQSYETKIGSTTWGCTVNGESQGYISDSIHPLDGIDMMPAIRPVDGLDYVELSFEVQPSQCSAVYYLNDPDRESYPDEVALEISDNKITLPSIDFGCVIVVYATYDTVSVGDDGDFWGGHTEYWFYIEG